MIRIYFARIYPKPSRNAGSRRRKQQGSNHPFVPARSNTVAKYTASDARKTPGVIYANFDSGDSKHTQGH